VSVIAEPNIEVWVQVNCPRCGRRACDVQITAKVVIRARCQRHECGMVFEVRIQPPPVWG
jgi:transcription elongation factor Elf1